MKKILICLAAVWMLSACEKAIVDEYAEGNVILTFNATGAQTRGTITIGDYFTKLNVMIFNADGTKYFEKVRTQYASDENFGMMAVTLPAGEYTVVAVGHSSVKSATIKSPEMVQFTASNGEKLTDTFAYCGSITVGEQSEQHTLTMNRVTAMVRFALTDEEIPASMAKMEFSYTGGSSNFNPTTFEGTTKSTQSETRPVSGNDQYQIFSFPYMASTGTLKVTVSALTSDGTVIRKRTFNDIPITRNRVTIYTGPFFGDGDGTITQTGFGFQVNGEWDGEDIYSF